MSNPLSMTVAFIFCCLFVGRELGMAGKVWRFDVSAPVLPRTLLAILSPFAKKFIQVRAGG